MERSIATDLARPASRSDRRDVAGSLRGAIDHISPTHIGLFFVILALGIYVFSNPGRVGWYDHFVWQADAFLHGRFAIAWPVSSGPHVNAYFQDVMPLPSEPGAPSYGLLPFPPLPAVLLMPFVAIFGLATDDQLLGAILGAINVGLAWRMVSRLTERNSVAVLATLFFAFGTVHWYAAMLSTTWFLAHLVALTFVLLGITLALDADRREQLRGTLARLTATPDSPTDDRHEVVTTIEESSLFLAWGRRARAHVDGMQFVAGFVFGIAALARLPAIFGAPFFIFVGGGGTYWRRAFSAGLGAVIPVGALLIYNLAATGHLFNPAYEWLFQTEYLGYLPPGMEINRDWGIEDPRFIPMNSLIMFLWPPDVAPLGTDCGLSLLNPDCPLLRPSPIGMSILLTSPAFLLALPLVALAWRQRLVMGSLLAVAAIALLNLAHFSQGWVQFGYRFSNDFVPFALILVTLAIARFGVRWWTVALVAASIVINAWGVYWSNPGLVTVAQPTRPYNPAVPEVATTSSERPRVPALSFFFPAHNEAENIEAMVAEALEALPALADDFEIIAVDDGSRDATPELADRLAAENERVRVVHHAVNQGYGAALRSGFRAARHELVCFVDGDRQFRIADIGLLLDRMAEPDQPDVVVGYRLKRADPFIRLAYARAYRLALRIFYRLGVRDPDCACKLFRRAALADIRLELGGAFLSAELLIKLGQRGRKLVETGVPHYPRTAGSASGANPKVVLRAVRDFWMLRLRLWANRSAALARGEPVLGD